MLKKFSVVSLLTYSSILITFLTNVIIVRMLDSGNFGTYAFLIAIISIVEAPLIARGGELYLKNIGELWNNGYRKMAVDRTQDLIKNEKRLYLLVFFLYVVFGIILSVTKDVDPILVSMLALSIPFQTGYSVYKGFIVMTDKPIKLTILEVGFSVTFFTLSILGVYFFKLYGAVVAVSMCAFIKTIVFRWVYRSLLSNEDVLDLDEKKISLPLEVKVDKRSFHSILRNFAHNGIVQLDLIILGILQSAEMVALYKVAKSLAGLPLKISTPIWKVLYPKLVLSVNTRNSKEKIRVIQRGIILSSLFLAIVSVFCFVFGREIIVLLYGQDYIGSFQLFIILTLGYGVFYSVNGWFKIWAALLDNMIIGTVYYLSAMLFIVLFSYFFSYDLIYMSASISLILVLFSLKAYFLGRNFD